MPKRPHSSKSRRAAKASKTPHQKQMSQLSKRLERARTRDYDPPEISKGKIQKIVLPTKSAKVEQIIKLIEKDPQGFNALKKKDEYFLFTIEGNESRGSFKDIRGVSDLLKFYLQKGSANHAKFGLIRSPSSRPKGWRATTKVTTAKGTKKMKAIANKRYRARVKEKEGFGTRKRD